MNLSKYRLTVSLYEALRNPDGVIAAAPGLASVDDLFKVVWKNTSLTGGMALTETGLKHFVKTLGLAHWGFSVEIATSATILMMERYMTTPYFLISGRVVKQRENLVLFSENVATQLILYGNDLKTFLEAQDNASERPVIKQRK